MHTKEIKRQLPCHFTADQLQSKSEELANQLEELGQLEDQKKQVMTDFKGRIELVEASIRVLALHIRQKFEYGEVLCEVMMDTPVFGKKTIVRTDTGAVVGEEFMTPEDRQLQLNLADEDETSDRKRSRYQ
jgi:hypothetical protein